MADAGNVMDLVVDVGQTDRSRQSGSVLDLVVDVDGSHKRHAGSVMDLTVAI